MGSPSSKIRKSVYKSKRTNQEKYFVQVLLPRDTFEKLDRIARDLYPDVSRGRLSYALQQIIDTYYAWHTQRHTKPLNPRYNTREAFSAVLREIEMEYDFVQRIVPNPHMWIFVMRALNVRDERTVRKWLLKFWSEGLIKPINLESPIEKIKRFWKFSWEIVAVRV